MDEHFKDDQTATVAPKVTLRHPHTKDIQTVEGTPDKLVPLMVEGYVQHSPATSAEGE
jgi:hypothetical protein